MANKKTKKPTSEANETREDRLKAALKANLARRKAQSRERVQRADVQEVGKKQNLGDAGQEKDA